MLSITEKEDTQRTYVDNTGEHTNDSMRRLTDLQRKLGYGELRDVSKQEITALRDKIMKLDDHIQGSYREMGHLLEGRKRRMVKETFKEQDQQGSRHW